VTVKPRFTSTKLKIQHNYLLNFLIRNHCLQSLKYNTVISILLQYKNNYIIALFGSQTCKNKNSSKWCWLLWYIKNVTSLEYCEITFNRGLLIIHVHVDYNPLKGMLVLISSLKLSTVPYAAGPESRGHSRTAWLCISMSNCFHQYFNALI
jgi:hypothetical protein